MARERLTPKFIEALAPPIGDERIEVFDTLVKGFGVRSTKDRTRTFFCMYRVNGKLKRHTLGRFPERSLADARKVARDVFSAVSEGRDPAAEIVQAKRNIFDVVAADFMARYAKKNRSWRETGRIIDKDLKPAWGARPIGQITKADVHRVLDVIVDRGSGMMANRTLAVIRRLFNWAVERGLIQVSPAMGVRPPAKEVSRDRVLDDIELGHLWCAWTRIGYPFGPLCKLLALTAQRRDEVAGMRWLDLQLEEDSPTWTIPRELNKSDRAHTVHLAPQVVKLLSEIPKLDGSPYVFPSKAARDRHVSGFSKGKARVDELAAKSSDEEGPPTREKAKVAEYRLHDLRRTAASGMARTRHCPASSRQNSQSQGRNNPRSRCGLQPVRLC